MEAFISVAAAFLMIVGIVGIFWAVDYLFPVEEEDVTGVVTDACPMCGSDQIEGESVDFYGGGNISQDVRCLDCDRWWTDVYTLTEQRIDEED